MSEQEENGKDNGLSFRSQLVLYGLLLVFIVALAPLFIEVQRPWEKLAQLIDKGKIVSAQIKSDFNSDDLKQMNEFAFKIKATANPEQEDYLIWTFNLIIEGQKLSAAEIKKTLMENDADQTEVNEENLTKAYIFWQEQFASQPKLIPIFRSYKEKLLKIRESSESADFNFADDYVMADNGQALIYLIDSVNWWESSYPGLEYDVVKNDCPYFRSYLTKGAGFDTNPAHYYLKIFPKFDTDKWGNWFSVWQAEENQGIWNNFVVDFDASDVKKLMLKIAVFIVSTILAVAMIIFLLTRHLSAKISQPIHDLIAGIKTLMAGNYDYEVPKSGSREFGILIVFFNKMIKWLKERLNMKETLGKLLSEELAEQVAKHGLVLGGQKIEITNLFLDFAGFSFITKDMPAQEIVTMLNEYFSLLVEIIKNHGGFIDKFLGDGLLAIFGAPVLLENHALNAVSCAIEMQFKMRQFNDQRKKEGKTTLEMRVGLNSGEVIAGAIGSNLKLEYTAIGVTTNLAQRMEQNSQIGHILIAQHTFELIQSTFFNGVDFERYPQEIMVKSLKDPVKAYNIFIGNFTIEKNEAATNNDAYYLYKPADYNLKNYDSLTPEEKQKYTKVVKIP